MKETVITRQELAALGEYSCSIPTGVTIGKRWRRDMNAYREDRRGAQSEWVIGEFVDIGSKEEVGIKWTWAVEEVGKVHRGDL